MSDMVNTTAVTPVSSLVANLVQNFSIGVSTDQVLKSPRLDRFLPAGTRVYVYSESDGNIWDMAQACKQVASARLHPVPVVKPATIASNGALGAMLGRYRDAGAEALLILDTKAETPAGPFRNSCDVLETDTLERCGIHQIGFVADPLHHPDVDDAAAVDNLIGQLDYARKSGAYVWLTTRHCFTAQPVIAWLDKLIERGINLPVRAGIPGPADCYYPVRITPRPRATNAPAGLGRNAEFDRSPVCQWSSDKLLSDLADYRYGRAHSRLIGIHGIPLGEFSRAARWLRSFEERIECWAV